MNSWTETSTSDYLHVSSLCEFIRKPELEAWRARVGNKAAGAISRKAMKLGTAVHAIAEDAVRGREFKLDKKVDGLKECVAALQSWLSLNKVVPVAIETTLFDHENMIVGTPDLVVPVEVVDWKTSSQIRPDYIVQVNTYIPMAQFTHKLAGLMGRIVRLDPIAGVFTEYKFPFDDELYEATLGLARFIKEWRKIAWQQ